MCYFHASFRAPLLQACPSGQGGVRTADPRRFMTGLECLAFVDYSLAIKAGVHFTLCGGTICKLGTKVCSR
jgi:hypothetical protein